MDFCRFGAIRQGGYRELSPAGGFIDISQPTQNLAFAGTMTAGGLKVEVKDGKLCILKEGKRKKFIKKLDQITFSSECSKRSGQKVLFITERCVFRLVEGGLMLIEIAPGVTVEKDILPYMDFEPIISPDLKTMDERLFRDEPMGLGAMIGV